MNRIRALLRSLVAYDKQRVWDPATGLDLDLSYITPNIIVTSTPVSTSYQSWMRNPLTYVVNYLDAKHKGQWHLFNFQGEGSDYTADQVDGKVSYYPFPDHYPPTIEIISQCVAEIDLFLNEQEGNTAVLHCKAGKGRSGSLCCAYLVLQLRNDSSLSLEDILRIYTRKRMNSFGKDGISIKSQRRYLNYWYDMVHWENLRQAYVSWTQLAKVIRIYSIRISGFAMFYSPGLYFTISEYRKLETNTVVNELITLDKSNARIDANDNNWKIYEPDTPIDVTSEDIMIGIKSSDYLWFNVFFEGNKSNGSGRTVFNWEDIDGFKGTTLKGLPHFNEIEIKWQVAFI
ncbi:PTEN Phosphatidylinositol 3 [Candida maltosa Xu316]